MRRETIPLAAAAVFAAVYALAPVQRSASAAVEPQADPFVHYPNCDSARAAGAAPIHRGEPGYRPPLDRDDDGIACEPYRGRRGW
jgi:hypothetical protein